MFKKVDRDWGFYVVLREAPKTKWKILYFRRGAKLSMQRHFQREEDWRILCGSGIMKTTFNDPAHPTAWSVKCFDRLNIPQFMWHKFIAHEPTIVLEKQMGICEEEDIERA